MVAVNEILLILCIISTLSAVSIRFYVRVITERRFELIEYALIWALVLQITLAALQLRILKLLPTVQIESHMIEMQKLFFAGTFFYIGSLWGVKISINMLLIRLTRRFQRLHTLAVITLYSLFGSWFFIYLTYLIACWPVHRRWSLVPSQQCGPIIHAWDFWTHLCIHLITDIILCILPFPTLLKVTETRLRIAVCGVYSLAVIAIIVSLVRVVLLATDVQNSIKRIMVLTTIELTVCIIIGVIPGISSAFTRKYAQAGPSTKKLSSAGRVKSGGNDSQAFSRLKENQGFHSKSRGDAGDIELSESQHRNLIPGEDRVEAGSFTGSTDQFFVSKPEGLTK
ncbi:hypothetical protein BKA61DRAFT_683319 [Leptodontidium sp. MPI-SDFR-AT-0119]|nr:hypothetical protein BKA61DRAFT_683319 [Leptodontidium sp. MPI-SDFR-AT-0119]